MLRQSSRHKRHERHRRAPVSKIAPPPAKVSGEAPPLPPVASGGQWGGVPPVVSRRTAVLEDDPAWRLSDEGLARPVTTPYWMAGLVFGLPFVLLVLLAFLLR